MLENRTVLAKTDLGREAVARRTHNLNPRQRAILISINGETTVGALSTRFGAGAPDAVRPLLESLVDQGLVEAVDAAVDAMPAAGDAGAPGAKNGAVVTPFPVRSETAETRNRGVTEPVVPEPAEQTPALSAVGIADWPDVQRRAGEKLHEIMGADADLLNMRMSSALSESEFLAHLERAVALINEARGALVADTFWRELFVRE